MPAFGPTSNDRLSTAHADLQRLFRRVVEFADCTVLCGYRSKAEQDRAVLEGKSKTRYPNSRHNVSPSLAVDVAPCNSKGVVDWTDIRRFYMFGGIVLATAREMGIRVRWGGDWDGDLDVKDQNFNDLPHFELLLNGPANGPEGG